MAIVGLNPTLALYRRTVIALKTKFRGDNRTYKQFKNSLKEQILQRKNETDQIKISQFVFEFDIAREWITTEVVRADLKDDGQYKLKINKNQLQSVNLKPVRHPEYFEFALPQNLIYKS
ncbi:unnamed protein product [Blepharisma stoltei]|uniref:Uncharacterized protein n=1 Tax=Blepharisma stoltei TaxID=1481888 RepID=A0AAU9IDY1_9CILI|nr:unnamed protein product [Blepharisma stoltei]